MPLQYQTTKIRPGVLHLLHMDTAKIIQPFCNIAAKMRRKVRRHLQNVARFYRPSRVHKMTVKFWHQPRWCMKKHRARSYCFSGLGDVTDH